ncbi:MAG TPA: hypothetical protein VF515_20555 [Candidatus Binatia bacterium]
MGTCRYIAVNLLILLAGCTTFRLAPAAPLPPPQSFILTFWCGPPLAEFTDARAAEIAAAGFNLVGSPCEGEVTPELNLRALDTAARHGLRLSVADPRFNPGAAGLPGWESRLSAAVADYGHHPALGEYFVGDEPPAADFAAFAAVVARLRAEDPTHRAYVNLLPEFIPPTHLGADSYRDYLERFLGTVHPDLLSYDYYPFGYDEHGNEKDRSTFFSNLALIREQALQHDLPFMLIVLAMPHARYRDSTAAELRWQVFHALAFGARGISYFAYWTPANVEGADIMKFHNGLIEQGQPTLHYLQVAQLNREARAIAQELATFHSVAVADSAGEVAPPFPLGPIEAIEGGPVTAGLFTNGSGQLAILLVNRDYRHDITTDLHLRAGTRLPQVFDSFSAQWTAAELPGITLAAGAARLIRWP